MSSIEMDIHEGEGTTEMAEALVALYRKERLDAPVAKAYEIAAREYKKIDDVGMARKYAKLAVKMGRLWLGPGSPDWKRMKGLLEELEGVDSNMVGRAKQKKMGV
jgi:hypothetical protein